MKACGIESSGGCERKTDATTTRWRKREKKMMWIGRGVGMYRRVVCWKKRKRKEWREEA